MISIRVFYKGDEVGMLTQASGNSNYYAFRYADSFIEKGIELCPLLMPLGRINYVFPNFNLESFKGLPPMIADSLPDKYGSELLIAWQKMYGKTSLSALEALSYIGRRGMGALEFVPSVDKIGLSEKQIIEIDSLVEAANQLLNERKKALYSTDNIQLKQLISVGSSIGGARAKAIVAIDKDGNIKSGQISGLKDYEYCIIKFDGLSSDLSEEKNITYYTRIEYAYYLMAKDAGIVINPCSLIKINGRYHFKTKRFDRDEDGNKIHMLSLAGLAGYDFLRAGEHSYEEVALILRRLKCDVTDTYQLFKRMVFNVVCKNHDDHVKNISFLMNDDGEFRLSPAYDLSYSYNPEGDWTRHHQMSINGKVDDISFEDLLASAESMGISKTKAIKFIQEVQNTALEFKEYAAQANIPNDIAEQIYKQFCFVEIK